MVLAEQTGTETITDLHGLGLVAQSDGLTTEYVAYDGLGSVRQVADGAGRNDPCPCGSGRKVKHCHGARQAHRHLD